MVNLFIVYELDTWSCDLNTGFNPKDYLFGVVKLTRNADPDKYKYSGYGTGLDSRSEFSLPDGSIGTDTINYGENMSSSAHIDNNKKDVLIFRKDPIQELDDSGSSIFI